MITAYLLAFLAGDSAKAPGLFDGPMLPMLLVMGVVFYFMMIRPQKKQAKEREQMLSNLKKNDHVITTGGIFAIIDKVKDNEYILKIDERSDVRMRVAKSAIAGLARAAGTEDKKPVEEKTEKK